MIRNILVALFIILALSIIGMMRFTGRLTKPLGDLTAAAKQADEGNYEFSLEYDKDDEIGILTHTFKQLAANTKEKITKARTMADIDPLTGIKNKHAYTQWGHLFKESALDAVVCDINKFHTANKEFGRQFGDRVLHDIGICMRKLARKTGGISCRESGDTFLLYCQHQDDYEKLLKEFLSDLFAEKKIVDNINIRFGVFTNADQETDMEERFERARIAADRVKNDPERICGYYDLM